MHLAVEVNIHNILTFLEYMYCKHISPSVLKLYIWFIHSMCRFNIDTSLLNHVTVSRCLRSISINSSFSPIPQGIFDIKTFYHISIVCDLLYDPRVIFLVAFFGFLRMSNIVPDSAKLFHQDKLILRKGITFSPTRAYLLIK